MNSRYRYAHPPLASLALYARRDLPFFEQIKMGWHVRKCAACRNEVSVFADRSRTLRQAVQTEGVPAIDLTWSRLEQEMLGNIAVGVAAARCIENVGNNRVIFRTGWIFAALSLLFALAWYTHIPAEQNARILAAFKTAFHSPAPYFGTELDANADGISVQTQGTTMRFIHPSSAVVSLSGFAAVSARYVDEDTGQITITKVYAQ